MSIIAVAMKYAGIFVHTIMKHSLHYRPLVGGVAKLRGGYDSAYAGV